MPTTVISGLSQVRQDLTPGQDLAITQTGQLVYANNQSAIHLQDNNAVYISGEVVAMQYFGLTTEADAGTIRLLITDTGSIATMLNYDVIQLTTTSSIDAKNYGTITGYVGIEATVTSTFQDIDIRNGGEIYAETYGLHLTNSDSQITVNNTGLIQSAATAVFFNSADPSETSFLYNSGILEGQNASFFTHAEVRVENTGSMIGGVTLSNHDDRFYSQSGEVVGQISLRAGNDIAIATQAADTILAGSGNDLVRGKGGDDFITGMDDDDTLEGGSGDDTLEGNTGYDALYGNGGDDSLDGGGRGDLLVGGKGNDTMTGGGGGDVFVIRRVGNGDDEVTDFQNGLDVVDISALGVQNFNWLTNQYNALSQDTDAVIVDLAAAGGSGSIRLVGVSLADMDASDFVF